MMGQIFAPVLEWMEPPACGKKPAASPRFAGQVWGQEDDADWQWQAVAVGSWLVGVAIFGPKGVPC